MRVYGQRYQGKTELVRKRKKWYRQSAIALFLLYAFFLMVKAGTGRETLAKRFFSYIQNEISMSMTRQYIPTVAYMAEGRQEQTLSDFLLEKVTDQIPLIGYADTIRTYDTAIESSLSEEEIVALEGKDEAEVEARQMAEAASRENQDCIVAEMEQENAQAGADAAAEALGINADGVLIGSTGVIGKQLPIDRIVAGVKALAEKKNDTLANGTEAAKAIMTTDTCEKQIAVEIEVAGKTVTIGGMAKGSGMIHPNMCTMLSFITTDAAITKEALQKALSDDVNDTYNMISVDGDTSTNDSVVLLANGMAENEVITVDSESYKTFAEALHEINEYLAKKIAGDGEGATALFEVTVVGADTKETAKTLAKSIVCSNLTKAAIAGHDANWGRILCAMGYSGAQFDPEKVDLFFESKAGKIQIIENGTAVDYSEEKATEILSQKEVKAVADVKMGSESATAWGCDLTHGYIDINADYRS